MEFEAQTSPSPSSSVLQSGLSRSERFLILTLALVQFTHITDFMILMPLGPTLMRTFEITPRLFGFIVAAYALTAGVSSFVGAFFVDRFDRKKALQFCYVGFTVGTFACALAPNYQVLLLARALAGLFGGILGAIILAMVGDTIPLKRRGEAMGILMASFSAASVFGVPFGLYLSNLFSWHAPFVAVGIVGIINMIVIAMQVPKMTGHIHAGPSVKPLKVLARIVEDANQVRALIFMFLLVLSQFCIIPFISGYMVRNVGFSESQLPWIYLIGGGLTIFSSPFLVAWLINAEKNRSSPSVRSRFSFPTSSSRTWDRHLCQSRW